MSHYFYSLLLLVLVLTLRFNCQILYFMLNIFYESLTHFINMKKTVVNGFMFRIFCVFLL